MKENKARIIVLYNWMKPDARERMIERFVQLDLEALAQLTAVSAKSVDNQVK